MVHNFSFLGVVSFDLVFYRIGKRTFASDFVGNVREYWAIFQCLIFLVLFEILALLRVLLDPFA